MTEPEHEQQPEEESLADQFRSLGMNLAELLRAAWESPERKRLQGEIETGLVELRTTLRKEAENLEQSPTGQRIKADVDDLRQRIESGEAEAKVRQELLNALQIANTELQKVTSRWTTSQEAAQPASTEPASESSPPPQES